MNKIDISQCELEPVRFLGSIQSFGGLLVLDKELIVTHASRNIDEFTTSNFESILGAPYSPDSIKPNFKAKLVHKNQYIFVEIEPSENVSDLNINSEIEKFYNAKTLQELLVSSAKSIHELTKIDRVMIYRFHEDLHGEVVAESRNEGVDSFLGLHYPASDIPPQARQIFFENWVRIIPDVHASPVEIVGKSSNQIDLGNCSLRAVSPIHIEYLKNMHVGASLTISIIIDGKLWGLIACHHRTKFFLSRELRSACETIGRMMSSMINQVEANETQVNILKMREAIQGLSVRLSSANDIGEELTRHEPSLIDLIDAGGASAALYMEGYWAKIGNVPSDEQLDELAIWVAGSRGDLYFTNELSASFPPASAYKDKASGLLAVSIPKTKRNYIFWFRPEVKQTVKWAGDPDKKVDVVNGRLTPRASFDEWVESVEGRSLPWKPWEIRTAQDIRQAVMAHDLRVQYDREKKARQDAERAKTAREELMAVVSHDLKNPLTSIQMNANLLKKFFMNQDEKSKSVLDRILRSSTTMNNLIDDILNVTKLEEGQITLDLDEHDIQSVIRDVNDILLPLAQEKHIRLELDPTSYHCKAYLDYGRMLQVFTNIIGNALKFTPDGGTIISKITKCGPEFIRIEIHDSGTGIPKENLPYVFDRFWQAKEAKRLGTGLGLAIVKGIITKHEGEIWAESEKGQGTTFIIKLPLGIPGTLSK